MSALLAMVNGNAVFHMTSNEKTQAQLKAGPLSTTTFHSDLPYVFVREQFEISSYTTWSGSDGGRKFTLPTALKTFRTNNPDLAYLMILEDSSGNSWVHDPIVHVRGQYMHGYGTWGTSGGVTHRYYDSSLAVNGGEYLTAFTDADAQLEGLTDNSIHGNFDLTFRTWDTNDTSVTVFKIRDLDTTNSSILYWPHESQYFHSWNSPLTLESLFAWYNPTSGAGWTYSNIDLKSTSLDVVKVRFVFLNVTHSASTFELQKGFNKSEITISPSEFSVHNIDLATMTPLISHGTQTSGSTITPVGSGELVCGKGASLDISTAKIDTSNKIINASAPVLEIPPQVSSLTGWDINFSTRTIKRNSTDVFNDSISAQALGVIGSQEISFTTSETLTNTTQTLNVSSSATGSLGNVDSDTMFLASVVNGTDKLHSTSLFGVGNNLVGYFVIAEYDDSPTTHEWAVTIKIYLSISSTGSTSVKLQYDVDGFDYNAPSGTYTTNTWLNTSSVSFGIEQLKIRLIALGNLGQ